MNTQKNKPHELGTSVIVFRCSSLQERACDSGVDLPVFAPTLFFFGLGCCYLCARVFSFFYVWSPNPHLIKLWARQCIFAFFFSDLNFALNDFLFKKKKNLWVSVSGVETSSCTYFYPVVLFHIFFFGPAKWANNF